jgi:predicted DNA repair protein MutK
MAFGLLATLDEVAALVRLTAASLDDVIAQSSKAGIKAAGVVVDDAAVTPRYVVGLNPERELPMIGKIAAGSLLNKLILLPLYLLLNWLAPDAIIYLLGFGGAYLAYEGAEKVYESISPDGAHHHEDVVVGVKTDALTLERLKVKSAILTDFILSAEIMALTLSEVATLSFTTQVGVLVVVGLLITVLVYGVVGLIVRIDDVGVAMTKTSYPVLKTVGRSLVLGMPYFLQVLGVVGTAAMLWVGGSILIHTLAQIGFEAPSM